MIEAKCQFATLADVDTSTFARFAEYLHRGTYSCPAPTNATALPDASENGTQSSPPAQPCTPTDSDAMPPASSWESRPYKLKSFDFSVRGLSRLTGTAHSNSFSSSCEDHTEVFLTHARLYVFADRYDIANLRQHCLFKLHEALIVFSLLHERVQDVVPLVEYVYDSTPDRIHSADEMRELVIDYVAQNMAKSAKQASFQNLWSKEGSMSTDLAQHLVAKLDDNKPAEVPRSLMRNKQAERKQGK